ncbi:MAG: hypothetical protein L6R38_003626 [Xanthoria sp. 2 TBL-2021]|nr:MAG: hypothetical protein L6R38_003626 [Xanthoria sp. 2 TBL-2021]
MGLSCSGNPYPSVLSALPHKDGIRPVPTAPIYPRIRSRSIAALKSLTIDNINPHIKEAEYAVRGELAVRSEKNRAQLKKGHPPTLPEESHPLDQVISANIGNPQQLDQEPIIFFRQVLGLVE